MNKVIIYDSNKEVEVKSAQIKEDITFLESNNDFIMVGTLKGNMIIFNHNLEEFGKI